MSYPYKLTYIDVRDSSFPNHGHIIEGKDTGFDNNWSASQVTEWYNTLQDVHKGMADWCKSELLFVDTSGVVSNMDFWFKSKADAMRFKLRWAI